MKVELSRYNIKSLKDSKRSYGVIMDGNDNLFPDYLNGLYNKSITHQSILNDLVDYIIGKGFIAQNPQEQERLDSMFPKKKVRDIVLNKLIHNSITLECIKSKTKDIVEINCFNPAQIRVSAVEDGKPCEFKYRKSWDKQDTTNYRYTQDFEDIFKTDLFEGLFYWYDSGTFPVYYGRPKYLSGLDAIELEISIYMMHNHGAQNGMYPSMIIAMEDSGDPEQNADSIKSIQKQMTGVANAGKIGVIHYPVGGSPAQFTTPNLTGLDKIYENQYGVSEAGILKAHQIPSPLLIAGLNRQSGGFASLEEEMQWAKNELMFKIVEPNREEILDILNPIFKSIGVKSKVSFETLETQQIQVPTSEEMQADINDNLKNLSGRQMQNLERIVRKFKKGQLTRRQAELTLKSAFNLSDEEVDAWLDSTEEELTKLSEVRKVTLEEIFEVGESMEDLLEDGWAVHSVQEVDYDKEEELDNEIAKLNEDIKLVSTGRARPNQTSEQDGVKGKYQYKIRYRYEGIGGGRSGKSRAFCEKMVDANKLYRKEDIIQMSFSNVNVGFGPRGSNNYNIFLYKGGPNCHHYWERVTFIKEGLEDEIDVRSPKAQEINETRADGRGLNPQNPKEVGQKPINMPNRGYLMADQKDAWTKLKEWTHGSK